MGRFKEKLYRFMYGRYGTDDLYSFIMIVFVVLWLLEIVAVAIIPEGTVQTVISLSCSILITLLLVWTTFRAMQADF